MITIELIGVIGSFCFAISGVPQMIKSIKDKHSNGIAHGTILLWLIGELSMLIYTFFKYFDFILMINYLANFLIVGVIAWYKYKTYPKRIYDYVARKVESTRHN
jgi:uncharacterized protein with PQ loop repeat